MISEDDNEESNEKTTGQEKDEIIDEIIIEFKYEIEGLDAGDETEVEEIINNLMEEYIEKDDTEMKELVNERLLEEWDYYIEEKYEDELNSLYGEADGDDEEYEQ